MKTRHRQFSATLPALTATALMLTACLPSGETDDVADVGSNTAPLISGTPPGATKVGEQYSFTPAASDPDGDSLTFMIDNRPHWASFNAGNGTLSGMPNFGDEGTYSNIRIKVSDGQVESALPQFAVTVTQGGSGSATLSWTPPTQNEDGSPLNNLAGYKIYYGVQQGNYPYQVRIDNPGITTYLVDNLTPNTYYFVSTAFTTTGIESDYSNVASKIVN